MDVTRRQVILIIVVRVKHLVIIYVLASASIGVVNVIIPVDFALKAIHNLRLKGMRFGMTDSLNKDPDGLIIVGGSSNDFRKRHALSRVAHGGILPQNLSHCM